MNRLHLSDLFHQRKVQNFENSAFLTKNLKAFDRSNKLIPHFTTSTAGPKWRFQKPCSHGILGTIWWLHLRPNSVETPTWLGKFHVGRRRVVSVLSGLLGLSFGHPAAYSIPSNCTISTSRNRRNDYLFMCIYKYIYILYRSLTKESIIKKENDQKNTKRIKYNMSQRLTPWKINMETQKWRFGRCFSFSRLG